MTKVLAPGLPPEFLNLSKGVGMTGLLSPEDGFATVFNGTVRDRMPARTSGIYLWQAENGEAYVGQAVCVRSRLRQHLIRHRDIIAASFRPVSADTLDAEERRSVAAVESQCRMRNILLVKETATTVPLDRFLSGAEAFEFIERGNPERWLTEERRTFPLAEARQRPKLRKLASWGEEQFLVSVPVSEFVLAAIPRPMATEGRFWSATLFPDKWYARVNVGDQEVLTTGDDEAGFFARILAAEPITHDARQMPYRNNPWECILDWEGMADLLSDVHRMRPVRAHTLWLARHTVALHARSHSPGIFVPALTDRLQGRAQ